MSNPAVFVNIIIMSSLGVLYIYARYAIDL
jgi:hypothetical protein